MLKGLRALWRRGRGNQGVFSIEYYTIGKTPSLGLLYRTAINKTRPVAAFFDPRMLPNPRLWLETRLGALASLFHLVRKGEVAPISPQVGVIVNDALVTVVKPKPRETLDQLFDRAAEKPWCPRPERKTLYGTAKATPELIGSSRTGIGAGKYPLARPTQEFICQEF